MPLSGTEEAALSAEWAAHLLARRLRHCVAHLASGPREAREVEAAVERWLLAMGNEPRGAADPAPLARQLAADHPVHRQFASELRAKVSAPAGAVTAAAADARDIIAEAVRFPVVATGISVTRSERAVACRGRGAPAVEARLDARGLAAVERGGPAALARAAVRYADLADGSQQLGLPVAHYAALYAAGFRSEGFASPFNSRFLALGGAGAAYCSLFPDTDAPLGSLGSFFDADLNAPGRGAWAVNPPFVESLLGRALAHVGAALAAAPAAAPLLVVFLMPAWDDSPPVRALLSSPYRVAAARLPLGGYTLERPDGSAFTAPFGCHYVALRSRPPAADEAERLEALLREPLGPSGVPRRAQPAPAAPLVAPAAPPSVPYREEAGSAFVHEGVRYDLNAALALADGASTEQVPVAELVWVLDAMPAGYFEAPAERERTAAADLAAPILVAPDSDNRPTVVDGIHRLRRAVELGLAALPARRLSSADLTRLREAPPSGGGEAPPRGEGPPTYAIISGEVPLERRQEIIRAVTSAANVASRGGLIKALLVSKTGAEGLDLKGVREVHGLEPYWDWARILQLEARAGRQGSHDGLPPEERDFRMHLYLAVPNPERFAQIPEASREARTVDETFYRNALARHELNADCRSVLREVSLECGVLGYGHCRICVPTDAVLFHADAALDLRLPDPCEPLYSEEVAVRPLRVDGDAREFYYADDPDSPLGVRFYTYQADLGGHAEVDLAEPIVGALLAALGRQAS